MNNYSQFLLLESVASLGAMNHAAMIKSIKDYKATGQPLLYRGFNIREQGIGPVFLVKNDRDYVMGLKHSSMGMNMLEDLRKKFGAKLGKPTFAQTTGIRESFGETYTMFPVGKYWAIQSSIINDIAWDAASGFVDADDEPYTPEEILNSYTDHLSEKNSHEVIVWCESYWMVKGQHSWSSLNAIISNKQ